jgi:hypothetical protein
MFYERFPDSIRSLSAQWVGRAWFYNFWDGLFPLDGAVVMSSAAFKDVGLLCRAANLILNYLAPTDQEKMFMQLGQPDKHEEFMEELVPLARLGRPAKVEYEVRGEGRKHIEYRIVCPRERPLLLEVKHRYKPTVHLMQQLATANFQEDRATLPEAKWLFASVVAKFPETPPDVQLQGAWISAGVQHDRADLHRTFDALDSRRLHFAVIANSEERGYVLARTPEIEATVLNFFRLAHNPNAVHS